MNGDTAEIQISEMMVNSINLRFEDTKSGEVRDEGKTRPEVILREVLSQPGKVFPLLLSSIHIKHSYHAGGLQHGIPSVCQSHASLAYMDK